MNGSAAKVSVVIAVHNGADHLPATLESVLSQTGVELELILVDDGSDEPTKKVIASFRSDPRVKLVSQQNHGLTKALMIGCSMARSPLIARLDVGDEMLPGRLEAQAKVLMDDSAKVLVCSAVETVTAEGHTLFEQSFSARALELGLRDPLDPDGKTPTHASVMFRRSSYTEVGGYRPQFYFAQDLDLWTRLIEIGNVAALPEVLTRTVFTPASLSARYAAQQRQLRTIIQDLIAARSTRESERELLKLAARIGPQNGPDTTEQFDGNYFIGRCLLDQGSAHAKQYLNAALHERPLSVKAWWARARAFRL